MSNFENSQHPKNVLTSKWEIKQYKYPKHFSKQAFLEGDGAAERPERRWGSGRAASFWGTGSTS